MGVAGAREPALALLQRRRHRRGVENAAVARCAVLADVGLVLIHTVRTCGFGGESSGNSMVECCMCRCMCGVVR
jgi:hypothetical protein